MNAHLFLLSLALLSPCVALGTSNNALPNGNGKRPQIDLEEKEGERAQRPIEPAPSSVPNPVPQSYAIGDVRAFQVGQPQAAVVPTVAKDEKTPEINEDNKDAFFMAFDRGDVASCRRLLNANKANINDRDQRELLPVLSKYPRDIEQGFTPLMKAAATGVEELAELCLEKNADFMATTNICPWMATENAKIRLWDFCKCLRDLAQPYRESTLVWRLQHGEDAVRSVMDDDVDEYFSFITERIDALTIAAIGGHVEVVDVLLQAMVKALNQEGVESHLIFASVKDAMVTLIKISNIVTTMVAADLFAAQGIMAPKHSDYPIILTKLIDAYNTIDPDQSLETQLHAAWDQQQANNQNTKNYKNSVVQTLSSMMLMAMDVGSNEILQIMAQAVADKPSGEISWDSTQFIRNHQCGEKLAILLATNASHESLTWRLGRRLLEVLERKPTRNPIFLNRLHNFIREQRATQVHIDNGLNERLIPELAAIVRGYAVQYQLPPLEFIQRILAFGGRQRQQIIDQISSFREMAKNHKLSHLTQQITDGLYLLKTQPCTVDVLSCTRALLDEINAQARCIAILKQRSIEMIDDEIRRQQELIQPYR